MQSRLGSFIESCTNIAIGYGVALLAQAAISRSTASMLRRMSI